MFLKEVIKDPSKVDTKLEYHQTLIPKLWDGRDLKEEPKQALKRISDKFVEFLKVPKDKVVDVIITGSTCNYNWTKYSDIDLHLILDYEKICDDCPDFDLDDCMKAKKSLWNETHDITIYGLDVELYAQSKEDAITGNAGVYSLKNDKWVKEPKKEIVNFDNSSIKIKAMNLMNEIDYIIDHSVDDIKQITDLKNKIKNMRKSGLEKHGEYGLENLVFKVLRNNGYMEKLYDYAANIEDEALSL